MEEKLTHKIDCLNRVYDLGLTVDSAWDGRTEIRTDDGREIVYIGTEQECLCLLHGLWMGFSYSKLKIG